MDIGQELAKINAKLDRLLESAPAVVPTGLTQPDADGVTHLPQFGLRIKLDEPIAADWIPPRSYRSINQGRIAVGDVSNAPFPAEIEVNGVKHPVPKRSPNGYPLVYTTRRADGSIDYLARPGRIIFADDTFADEAELAGWRAANKESERILRGYGHGFSPG